MLDLRRMRHLINRLPMARLRVERAMSMAAKCTTVLTGMPGGGSAGSQVERGVMLLEVARKAYAGIKDELERQRDDLKPLIAELQDPLERILMTLRYIDGFSVREIAYRLTYSERHVFRVLADSEEKIEKMSVMSV